MMMMLMALTLMMITSSPLGAIGSLEVQIFICIRSVPGPGPLASDLHPWAWGPVPAAPGLEPGPAAVGLGPGACSPRPRAWASVGGERPWHRHEMR